MTATRGWITLASGLLALGALAATIVWAQDAIEVAGGNYEVVLENDKVRVLRGRYQPGSMSAMHEHPGSVVVQMTGGALRFTAPDGQVMDQVLEQGRVAWSGGAHSIENIGPEELEVIIVEVKNTSFLDRVFSRNH